eukprot:g3683.t1
MSAIPRKRKAEETGRHEAEEETPESHSPPLDHTFDALLHRLSSAGFVGRDWLATRVYNLLQHEAKTKSEEEGRAPFLVIFGGAGTGKSSFMANVIVKRGRHNSPWRNLHERVLAFHICRYSDSDTLNPKTFVRRLCSVLAEALSLDHLREEMNDELKKDLTEKSALAVLRKHVFVALKCVQDHSKDTIWIDSLDEARSDCTFSIVNLLLATKMEWPAWLRIIATSREDAEIRKELRPFDYASIQLQDEENRADIAALTRHMLEDVFRKQAQPSIILCMMHNISNVLNVAGLVATYLGKDEEDKMHRGIACRQWRLLQQGTVDAICRKAAGTIMYAKEVVKQVAVEVVHEIPFLDTGGLPDGLATLYMQRYAKIFASTESLEEYKEVSKPMLGILSCAAAPVPEKLLRAVVQNRDDVVRRHLQLLEHTCVRSADGMSLQFSHKSFSDWLIMEASPFQVNPKEDGHIHVARLMMNECAAPLLDRQSKVYLRRNGIAHMLGASKVEEARETVMRFAWYVERAKVKEWNGVLEDLGRLRAALPEDRCVKLLESAVRKSAGHVRREPLEVAGQMHARLMGYGEVLSDFLEEILAWRVPDGLRGWWQLVSQTVDPAGGACLQTLEGHSHYVNSVSFSPDGTKVASGSGDNTVKLWDVTSGECLQTLEGH